MSRAPPVRPLPIFTRGADPLLEPLAPAVPPRPALVPPDPDEEDAGGDEVRLLLPVGPDEERL